MKHRYFFYLLGVLLYASLLISCSKENEPVQQTGQEDSNLPMGEAYVIDSNYIASSHMKVYNFAYPSVDPAGNPIMLSATISMGDEVSRDSRARGMLLYNHFTIYRANQCPSRGELSMQSMAVGLGLITVSPDYYGFGVSECYNQAYCISLFNARTSIDALLEARKLLNKMGYSWDDVLLNVGYSQGGQTTMAVVRLAAEQYPDLDITYSFAGAGSYDLPETYRQFIDRTIAGMPSTVISVMLSYNEYKHLGIKRDEMFREPVLSHIDDWILSKRFTREEIDAKVGSLTISDYVTAAMVDTNSSLSRRFMETLDGDNLCHGWTPRGNEHIMLFHSSRDITVPVANTQNMYDFLISHGVQDVDLQIHDIGASSTTPAHENAALLFGMLTIQKIKEILGIDAS